ncbi:MAG: phospholipase D family protein [Rhodanobacter sp.]
MNLTRIHCIALVALLLLAPGSTYAQAITTRTSGQISVYFSPNGGAESAVVSEISQAKASILVQAYSFTSKPIYSALAEAKGRGVDVRVLVDKEDQAIDVRGNGARYDLAHGVPVAVDYIAGQGIAHNKVIVIDGRTVITGSFNFSRAAETTNAENLVVFHDAPELAGAYSQNWLRRASGAQGY